MLAQKAKKCLLIDLDLKRNAVAKAFNIEDKLNTKQLRPMSYKTFSENLFVWPSHNFVRSGHMDIIQLVQAAIVKFDYVLISCPCLDKSPDRRPIAAAADHNIIFTKNDTHTERLTSIISSSNSNVLANIQIMDTEEHHDILDHTESDDQLILDDPLEIETDHVDGSLTELDELSDIEPEIDLDDLDIEDELTVEPESKTEPDIDLDDLDDPVAGTDEDVDIDITDLFDDESQEDKS